QNRLDLLQQPLQIQWLRKHRQLSLSRARPLLSRAVPIKFHSVSIRIAQIQSLTDAMIGSAFQWNPCFDELAQSVGKLGSRRIKNGQMIKPCSARGWRFAALTFPRV